MCLYPKLIRNPKYTANKKNGGQVPPVLDERVRYVPIGCQNCIECRAKKARDWKVRLNEEIKFSNKGKFVTLTFSNEKYKELYEITKKKYKETEGYDLDNQIVTIAVRRFLERWRKKHGKSVRHWLVSELGGTHSEHIHLHGMIWTNEKTDIAEIWQNGHVWDGYVKNGIKENYINEKTVGYVVKYILKIDEIHKEYKSIILTSAGIGNGYNKENNRYNGEKTKEYYKTRNGSKLALPIYYRNKAFTDEEREKLWLNKLDKNERYILGVKIDISEGEEIYYKKLKEAQELNEELGYGTSEKDWKRVQYENERRKIKQEEKMNNNNKKKR